MTSSLGLCIEKNLIKYAKVTKDREELKVEVFGIKFYEDLKNAIKQIVSETSSENIPVSVNLSDEVYNYFDVSNLLNKNELKSEIENNFESYCEKKKISSEDYESRYSVSEEEGKDTLKVTHISVEKSTISNILDNMENCKVSTITPLGTSIANIISTNKNENVIIVNMDDETIITSIVNQKIYDVKRIKQGPSTVLKKIAGKENSYSKAYEICKNSTIYTIEGKEVQDEGNEYMDVIIPTLYKVVTDLQKYITKSKINYSKIYITGTLSVVNNVDLYFQEFFPQEKCEILKPYFIKDITKINIKDYIEVNSALALAMQDLGYGVKELNFKKQSSFSMPIPEVLKKETNKEKKTSKSKQVKGMPNKINLNLDFDMSGKLEKSEKWLLRGAGLIIAIIIVYSIFSMYLNNTINNKLQEADELISYTETQIASADEDINLINEKSSKYQEMIDNLNNVNSQSESDLDFKNAIPNLLVNIQSVIPENVQLTEIENTEENDNRHIIIKAKSEYYEELGYFKVKLKEDGILTNVVSTESNTEDGFIQTIIEGDLL